MKRFFLSFIYISIIASVLTACSKKNEDPTPVASDTDNSTTLSIVSIEPMKGKIGEQIKITVNKEINGINVSFNGTPATKLTTSSDKVVTVTIPENATTGKVVVKQETETATSTTDFEITRHANQLANLPGKARSTPTTFAIGNKIYVGMGKASDSYLKDFWVYNADNDAWTQVANFPGESRIHAVSFVIGTKAYIGTGEGSQEKKYKDFWVYDANTDQWDQVADFKGKARNKAVSFVLNGQGYVGTGSIGSATFTGAEITGPATKDFWKYDPASDQWTQITDFKGAERHDATSFVVDNKAYVGTGRQADFYKDFWAYDANTDQWTQITDLPGKTRIGAVGFSLSGKGYVGLGIDDLSAAGTTYAADMWAYDPTTKQWASASNPESGARAYATAFGLHNTGYIGLGYKLGKGTSLELWKYTP
ncbi:kelch repeat-containing protein [uncultured Microscilla sp.]|uniref:Kelch repeat-containing protein n=1 Tax=uncultured Microscilla sp. TaxID=432653 RepID=UPI0026250E30|nr:kelch repeat-containing protein [uncultured Microscilla sp.]